LSLKPGEPWEEGIWRPTAERLGLAPEPQIFSYEEIPRTPTGKVRRKVLEELMLEPPQSPAFPTSQERLREKAAAPPDPDTDGR
jgi:acyl-coenzyme A synthetase/AMP-(fatty) acid ligase